MKHAAALRSMLQHTENSAQTKILIPSLSTRAVENDGTLVDRCSGCGIQVPDSIPSCQHDVLQAETAKVQADLFPPPLVFFSLVVLCFDRPLLSSLCLLMSTVEPTAEGTTQPKRNKETTRSTTDRLQWAIGEGIGQYLCCTDT